MNADEFIEAMGRYMDSQGLPPMAGRVWGFLLIADPPEQTAAHVAERLGASRGAISGALRLLSSADLILRTTRRGDRREWLRAPVHPAGIMNSYLPRVNAIRAITEDGLELVKDLPPPAGLALRELHDFFAFFEREWPDILSRFQSERNR